VKLGTRISVFVVGLSLLAGALASAAPASDTYVLFSEEQLGQNQSIGWSLDLNNVMSFVNLEIDSALNGGVVDDVPLAWDIYIDSITIASVGTPIYDNYGTQIGTSYDILAPDTVNVQIFNENLLGTLEFAGDVVPTTIDVFTTVGTVNAEIMFDFTSVDTTLSPTSPTLQSFVDAYLDPDLGLDFSLSLVTMATGGLYPPDLEAAIEGDYRAVGGLAGQISVVPEPATLVIVGIGALAVRRFRRRG